MNDKIKLFALALAATASTGLVHAADADNVPPAAADSAPAQPAPDPAAVGEAAGSGSDPR